MGINWNSCILSELLSTVGFASVDDTDLVEFASDKLNSPDEVTEQMQEALAHWEGVLHAPGGAIRAYKSFWYLVSWQFQNGIWRWIPKATLPGPSCG